MEKMKRKIEKIRQKRRDRLFKKRNERENG